MSQHVNTSSPNLRILDPSTIRLIQLSQAIPSYESLVASLVHDSINSSASRVLIKLQPASLRVTVIDNSEGIHPREWRKLFSKSAVPQGRGKTLQAIAAVSCLELSSSRSDIHLQKTVRGGIVLEDSRPNAVPISLLTSHGVAVDVWELFHNFPVRRRAALQVPTVKLVDNVRRRIVAIALSNVHVHVTLEMNAGIIIFESPSLSKLSVSLLEAVIVTRHRRSWLPVNAEQGVYKLHGYIAELAMSRATEAQIVSINGVPLDQSARVYKLLRKTRLWHFSQRMSPVANTRPHPAFVLNVQCPPGDVHVSAAEHGAIVVGYKLDDVEQFVADSVLRVLRTQHATSESHSNVTGGADGHRVVESSGNHRKNIQTAVAIRVRKRIWTDMQNHDFKEAMLDLNKFARKPRMSILQTALPRRPLSAIELRTKKLNRPPSSSRSGQVRRPQTAAAVVNGLSKNLPDWRNPVFHHQGRAPKQIATVRSGCSSSVTLLDMNKVRVERKAFHSMCVIGQVDLKFIMTTDARGTLYAIDQHAASERALFERLLRNLGQGTVLSQNLMPPMTLQLSAEQCSLVSRYWNDFHRWGWQLSQSSARGLYAGAVRVHGVPCIGPQGICIESAAQFMAFVDALAEGASPICVPVPFRDAIAMAACHAAVRFGDVLSMAQCTEIVQSLAKCDSPFSCAHGRPSIVPLAILKSK